MILIIIICLLIIFLLLFLNNKKEYLSGKIDRYVTFKEIGNLGRLGNQLFQYAAGVSLALENNCEFYLPSDILNREWDGQKTLLNSFNLNYKTMDISNDIPTFFEPSNFNFKFMLNFFDNKPPINLYGFFQSEKYFKKHKDYIKNIFSINQELLNNSKDYLNKLCSYTNKTKIGLHIRRGDYIEIDTTKWINELTKENWFGKYLDKCLNVFTKDCIIIIFTGGNKNNDNTDDIKWCNNILKPFLINKGYNDIVISNKNDTMTDFISMSLCDHLIITNISSFSWWAGYLNKNNDKKILVPYTTPTYKEDELIEYWADEFIKINI